MDLPAILTPCFHALDNGELYDATKELRDPVTGLGFGQPGYDTGSHTDRGGWTAAALATGVAANTTLKAQMMPPITTLSALPAVAVTEPKPGVYVADFGQNTAAVLRATFRGLRRGQNVTMRFAEVLMHPPYGPADGTVYQGNLRSAKATDTYIARGPAPPGGHTA